MTVKKKLGKFRTRILAQQKMREENNNDKPLQKNMGVEFVPKTGPNAGKTVTFRMKDFPPIARDLTAKQEKNLNPAHKEAIKATFKRYSEDEDGMLRLEELRPLNRMGAVPFQRNEMPMAYKQKVVKKTAAAKAVPFTNRNAL